MPPLAYFLTFHTYGTYLHGHERGSVDRDHNAPGAAFLPASVARAKSRESLLKHEPTTLDEHGRFVVDATIRDVCKHRSWVLRALNVRTNHAHVVVSASDLPEKVLADLKAWSTRRLRESGLVGANTIVWSHHGSTRYIDSPESLGRAIEYTMEEQGEVLPMSPPPGWNSGRGPST